MTDQAPNVVARPPAGNIISQVELEKELARLTRKFALVSEGKLKHSEVMRAYAEKAGKGATAKEKALNCFMWAIIQMRIFMGRGPPERKLS